MVSSKLTSGVISCTFYVAQQNVNISAGCVNRANPRLIFDNTAQGTLTYYLVNVYTATVLSL